MYFRSPEDIKIMLWQQYEIRFINFRNSNINLVFNLNHRRILQIERQQTGITEYIQSPGIFLEYIHREKKTRILDPSILLVMRNLLTYRDKDMLVNE